MDSAKRVINGTWGELWVDGEHIAEAKAAQAKFTHTKNDVDMCGQMATDTKIVATKGTGSVTIYKVRSRWLDFVNDVLAGRDRRVTIISKLADPDAYGAERMAISNVSFDEATLFDWKAKTLGESTIPFTFTQLELIDFIPGGN